MNDIGHNNPPSAIDFMAETGLALGKFLKAEPVIQTEETARAGKVLLDRASLCIKDAESERRSKTDPLNRQVSDINETYRSPRNALERIISELRLRLDAYVKAEEAKKLLEAEEKRKALEEAERRAKEAEQREQELKQDAKAGVVDSDVALATVEADAAFEEYQRASRVAARAEKATKVKVGGGFGRALSARTKETLIVTNWQTAIEEMGLTDAVTDAILTSARAYRQITGDLPAGVQSTKDRSL